MVATQGLSEAKAQLSRVMGTVVHEHQPIIVDRHHGREAMVLFERHDLLELLEAYRFDPQVTFDAGEWVIRLPEFGLVAGGDDFDSALDELLTLSEQYVADFLARRAFFMQTDRARQAPWVYRFALTEPEDRRSLFVEPPARPEPAGREAQALA
jgi:Antitoxin of toxin-antitoxin, RelE / RelB, TA system